MRGCSDRHQVGERPRAVCDVREAHQRHVVAERRGDGVRVDAAVEVGLHQTQLESARGGETFEDISVGGEVVVVGDDGAPARLGVQRRRGELEQVDAGGVGEDDVAAGYVQYT